MKPWVDRMGHLSSANTASARRNLALHCLVKLHWHVAKTESQRLNSTFGGLVARVESDAHIIRWTKDEQRVTCMFLVDEQFKKELRQLRLSKYKWGEIVKSSKRKCSVKIRHSVDVQLMFS